MLLAPDGKTAIGLDLCSKDTFDALVEGCCHTTTLPGLGEITLIGLLTCCHVAEHPQGMNHRVVVVGDMNLVIAHLGPELWPATIFILAAKQIVDSTTEGVTITFVMSGLVKSCEEIHLQRGCIVVGGRVITFLPVAEDLFFFLVGERTGHINILGPSASDTLEKEQLITDATSLGCLEESGVCTTHRLFKGRTIRLSENRHSHHDENRHNGRAKSF